MTCDFGDWLASPTRVMATLLRGFILSLIIIPPLAFGSRGLVLSVMLGMAPWMFFVVAIYGPKVMVHEPVSLQDWLWRHVTALWETPLKDA